MEQQSWDEMNKIARNNVCGECGGELTVHSNRETGKVEVGCLKKDHHGFIERESYTQAMRRGAAVPSVIQNAIERKMLPKDDLKRSLQLLAARYPDAIVDYPTASLFIMDCIRLDLDPLIQPPEVVPALFKPKIKDDKGRVIGERNMVVPIITGDGWLSMSARGCPEKWCGAPRVEMIKDPDLAESLCSDREAWVYKATGRTRDMAPGESTIAYGYFTHDEHDKAKAAHLPAGNQPGNQARVRSIKHWVRENFPDCRQRMMALTEALLQRSEGVKEVQDIIDGEFHLIDEKKAPAQIQSPKQSSKQSKDTSTKTGDKTGTAARASGAGVGGSPDGGTVLSAVEGDHSQKLNAAAAQPESATAPIDMDWVKTTLADLHWSEVTAISWMTSQPTFKGANFKGTLKEVLYRLTSQQLNFFCKQLQQRVDAAQSLR